jgi:chemotaxis methyl-accepting protein methylase
MAIVLNDCKMLQKSSAFATDLSSQALAKAMEGSYSAHFY